MRKIACFTLALLLGVPSTVAAEATLLTNATVVDVASGRLAAESSVLIRDGIIIEVGGDVAAPDAVRVDAGGGFLIPGLGIPMSTSSPLRTNPGQRCRSTSSTASQASGTWVRSGRSGTSWRCRPGLKRGRPSDRV